MKFSEKGIMSCAGSIRGAIAFGLAISIDTKSKANKEVLVSSTLILVFFTTIVFGALMPMFIKFFKSFDKNNSNNHMHPINESEEEQLIDFLHPNFTDQQYEQRPKEKNFEVLKNRLSYWLGTYWLEFDYMYMKPRLVHNWPSVKVDNDNIAKKIKDSISEFGHKRNNLGVDTNKMLGINDNFVLDKLDDNNISPKKQLQMNSDKKLFHTDEDSPADAESSKEKEITLFNNLKIVKQEKK